MTRSVRGGLVTTVTWVLVLVFFFPALATWLPRAIGW